MKTLAIFASSIRIGICGVRDRRVTMVWEFFAAVARQCLVHTRYAMLVAAALPLWMHTAKAQTVIDTIQQLEAIDSNLSGNYVLGANINASGFNFTPIGQPTFNLSTGNYVGYFSGTFNGEGYTISNLSINASVPPSDETGHYAGLFGEIGSTAVVQNVGLLNESVSLTAGGNYSQLVGGIAGENWGTITNAYTTGAVTGYTPPPSGYGSLIGGLVGLNGGSIAKSYSTASVSALSPQIEFVGGLVGGNSGVITQSYAAGPITAAGGNFGGLVGSNFAGSSVSSSYWDTNTTGAVTSAGGTGTAQLKSGLPSGFDPTVWGSSPSINNGYPYLLNTASDFQGMTSGFILPNLSVTQLSLTQLSLIQQSQQSGLALMNNAIAPAQILGSSVSTQLSPVQAINAVNAVDQLHSWVEIAELARGEITSEEFLTPGPWTLIEIASTLFLPDVAYAPTVNNFYQWGDPFQIFSYDLTVQVPDSDILNLAIGEQFLANYGILDQPSFSEFQVSNINGDDVTFQVWNLTSLPDTTPIPDSLPLFVSGSSVIALLVWRAKRRSKALA